MDTKHTAGPWEITSISQNTGNIGVGHKEQRILIAEVTNAASFGDMLVGAMNRGGGGFEQDDCHTQFANARLIAAAPDLLTVLVAIREQLVRQGINFGPLIADAEAAISKATS